MTGIIKSALVGLAGAPLLREMGRKGTIAVCFHGVEEQIEDTTVQLLHMQADTFAAHLDWLQREFDVIDVKTLADLIRSGARPSARLAVITLDDGYRNNLTVAAPLLHQRDLPFTVFVSTRHLDEGRRFPMYIVRSALLYAESKALRLGQAGVSLPLRTHSERLEAIRIVAAHLKATGIDGMNVAIEEIEALLRPGQRAELDARFSSEAPLTWPEAKQLAQFGGVLGAHSHDHVLLHERQSAVECLRQIRTCRERLNSEVGYCGSFAYPNGGRGDFSRFAVETVEKEGFSLGFTTIATEIHADDPPFALPRLVAGDMRATRFLACSTRFRRGPFAAHIKRLESEPTRSLPQS